MPRLSICAIVMIAFAAAASLQRSAAFAPSIARGGAFAGNTSTSRLNLLNKLFGSTSTEGLPIMAEETVMNQKAHGTSDKPVQKELRWNCDYDTADRICNFNRHYAEFAGYWQTTEFLNYVKENYKGEPLEFFDSVTGELLFKAPVGRSMEAFLKESASHGWPSFRDEEVVWDYVRCLRNGECISTTGTHLGHNLPDGTGNRYCINLVSVAGMPEKKE
uniref:Peptide-methionine (R)-S-oxide reductase n=1 Tax=Entomoneis paludosa TaxID=265537 RepID=A0A7S3DWM7_9STRA|mmetsp:Transcript_7133/g.14890  ORF Transcript_7133/g.14890 Transcript_7133/m.14890 type:complete len:218 (+) Transcript_7133:50-703(+)